MNCTLIRLNAVYLTAFSLLYSSMLENVKGQDLAKLAAVSEFTILLETASP